MEEKKCCVRRTVREQKEHQAMISRLNRVEGQIRGIRRMVEEDRYCVDILTQVMAVQAALNSFNKKLLVSHIQTCVVDDMKEGRAETMEELCTTIQKLMK